MFRTFPLCLGFQMWLERRVFWAGRRVQQVKVLAETPEDGLSSILETPMVKGESCKTHSTWYAGTKPSFHSNTLPKKTQANMEKPDKKKGIKLPWDKGGSEAVARPL